MINGIPYLSLFVAAFVLMILPTVAWFVVQARRNR